MSLIGKLTDAPPSSRATQAHATGLTVFVDALLRVLGEAAPESDPPTTAAFRATLKDVRGRIANATQSQHVSAAAAVCVAACEQYLRTSRRFHTQREIELLDMIELLRDAMRTMGGGASEFGAEVLSSSGRLRTLLRVDDLRDLKRRISDEVVTLQRAAEARQDADRKFAERLGRRVEALQASLIKVEREASCDPLTGIANRRGFDRTLPTLIAAARASGTTLSLVMLDLDHFKKINDSYGHVVGDRVLLCAADSLVNGVRKADFVARRGGDEFAVVLVGASLDQATKYLDTLIRRVASQEYEYQTDPRKTLRFTMSCGIAELAPGETEAMLIERADLALRDAKRKGQSLVAALFR